MYTTDDNEEDVRNEKNLKCFELSKRLDGENETENADLNWRFCQVLVQVSADCQKWTSLEILQPKFV